MTLLWPVYIISIALTLTKASRADGSTVYCAFVDDQWMSQRRETAHATEQRASGMFAPDNMANKIHTKPATYVDPDSYGEVMRDNKTIRCPDSQDFCYTLWEGDPNDKSKVNIIKQGCWDQSDRQTCSQPTCLPRPPVNHRHNNTHFCCCSGDLCNVNVTTDYSYILEGTQNPAAKSKYHIIPDPNYRYRTITIALVSVFGVAVVIALSYLVYRLMLSPHRQPYKPEHLVESPPTPMFDLDQLKFCSLLSGGRYGDVWKGTLSDTEVAVKLFAPMQKQYFYNERDIYTLPHIEHPSLLKYYGSEENMHVDGMVPYSIIVMSYLPNGTLSQYLKEHVIDWNQMIAFTLSTASGLAHLHTDVFIGDKEKPAIAHRDFNSRNILIKEDLTCCICDYGFAMKILGSKFIRNGLEEVAEQSPISDVGTLRYMAPEVLDGAVNLRDCEASLKQIDVYALGLVLWEIASRCSDLYQGMPVPEYKLPFEADLGAHPSFEDMQRHVSWKRGRPIFPDVWKDSNPAIRALKETIEDSWDQDAEARLTALCVEERIFDMMSLWESRTKVGVTPTNPATLITGIPETIVRNPTSGENTNAPNTTDHPDRHSNIPNGTIANGNVQMVNIGDLPPGMRLPRGEVSVSGSTVETMLTASPSDPLPPPIEPPSNKASNLVYARTNQPLQPHQGQNPTVERNTHKRSDDKLVVIGNTLMDKSVADEAQGQGDRNLSGGNNTNFTEDLFEAIADNLESSLVQNDLLGHQQYPRNQDTNTNTTHNPNVHNHNYVQGHNQLHNNPAEPLIARPKQPNVPGNGSAYPVPNTSGRQPQPQKQKKFKLKKPRAERFSGKMNGLYQFGKNLLKVGGHDSGSDDSANYPTENLRNPAQMTSGVPKTSTSYQEQQELNPGKSNLEPRQVPTEVCLMNGATVVRPMSLPMGGKDSLNYNVDQGTGSDSSNDSDQETLPKYRDTSASVNHNLAPENHLGFAEVGIAKLQIANSASGQPAMKKVQLRSQSSIDLSPTGGALIDMSDEELRGVRRPSSLSVNGHNYSKIVPRSVPCLNNLVHEEHSSACDFTRNEAAAYNTVASTERLRYTNRDTSEGLLKARYSANGDRIGDVNIGKREPSASPTNGQSTISLTQFGGVESDPRHHQPADYPC